MHKVRVSMFPDRELEVDDAEYTDLKRQGLLIDNETPVKTRRASVQTANEEDSE
jgi:hypothetical protein